MVMSQYDLLPYFGKYQRAVAIAYYNFLYFVFYFVSGHGIYVLFTLNYPVIAFYLLVMFLQRMVKKSEKYIYFVNNIIQIRKGFKSVTVVYDQQIPDSEKCMFGFHPHGVLSISIMVYMNYKNGSLSRMVGMASRFMLSVPFVGIILRLWGLQGVHHSNMKKLLKRGQSIGLVPGGFEEATLTVSDQLRVFIKQRKGFIKYALQQNYTIYPVLSLSEHRFFSTFPYLLKFRLWLNKFKIPAVLFWNYKSGILLNSELQFHSVVGRGIRGRIYAEGERPTSEEVNKAHAQYIEQLKRMHQKHKSLNEVPLKIY